MIKREVLIFGFLFAILIISFAAAQDDNDERNLLQKIIDWFSVKLGPRGAGDSSTQYRVFVSSTNYTGAELSNGDSKCQQLAQQAGLSGTWKAWLSTSAKDAKSKISNAKYVRLDGLTVANSKADLLDGSLQNPINVNEYGVELPLSICDSPTCDLAYTGTNVDGTRSPGFMCNDWTSESAEGKVGYFHSITGEWTAVGNVSCVSKQRIYCFEVSTTGKIVANNSNPTQKTHLACWDLACTPVSGTGPNTCATNADCSHLACVSNSCTPVAGSGTNECSPQGSSCSSGVIEVCTPQDLDNVRNNLNGNYLQVCDIDLAGYSNWKPIGDIDLNFYGSYDGNHKEIRNLKISENPLSDQDLGLFRGLGNPFNSESTAYVKGIILKNVSIEGSYTIGALAGSAYNAMIYDTHVVGGVIKAKGSTGGLIGQAGNFVINKSSVESLAIVNSSGEESSALGGLIGNSNANTGTGITFYYNIITHSYVRDVLIKGNRDLGGLAGIFRGTIEESYSFADIEALYGGSGGLVGYLDNNRPTNILNSYSLGTVHDLWNTPYPHDVPGGLIGTLSVDILGGINPIVVKDSYSGVLLTSSSSSGGLIGKIKVEGPGAFSIDSSYWDTDISGQQTSAGGQGLATWQMRSRSSYSGWDFTNTWNNIEEQTYPWLAWQNVDEELYNQLYFPFDVINNQAFTPDNSLYANHGKVGNAHIINSIRGPVLEFLGTPNGKVGTKSDIDVDKFTLAGWIKLNKNTNETGQSAMKIIDKGLAGQSYSSYGLLINASNSAVVRIYTANSASGVVDVGSSPIQKGTWYFVAATFNGTNLNIYINGILKSSRTANVGPYNNNEYVSVGAQPQSGGGLTNLFYGSMDDVRIYSRALSAQEIQALYQGG